MFDDLAIRKITLIDITFPDSSSIALSNNIYTEDYTLDYFKVSDIENSILSPISNCQINNITNSTLRIKALRGLLIKSTITVTYVDIINSESIVIFSGQIKSVDKTDNSVSIDCDSLLSLAEQDLNIYMTNECTNDLGDSLCGVNLATYTVTGTITTVNSRYSFEDTSRSEASNYFQYGVLTMTSGNNNGISREVSLYEQTDDKFTFFIPFPYDLNVGDTYSVYRGCQKDQQDCNFFSNWSKFRGYSILTPNLDELRYEPEPENDEDEDSDNDSDEA